MYVYDVKNGAVNLSDKDIYIRAGLFGELYQYVVVAEGPLSANGNTYVASRFTLWRGTWQECVEYHKILAEVLDCRDIGDGLSQTRKDEKNGTKN